MLSTFEEAKEFAFVPPVSKDNNHDEVLSLGQTYLDVIWDVESENITQELAYFHFNPPLELLKWKEKQI